MTTGSRTNISSLLDELERAAAVANVNLNGGGWPATGTALLDAVEAVREELRKYLPQQLALRARDLLDKDLREAMGEHPVVRSGEWVDAVRDFLALVANSRVGDLPVGVDEVARKSIADLVERADRDVRRYARLRLLGVAPSNSKHLANGTVLCFQNLDDFVDADLAAHPNRGEAASEPDEDPRVVGYQAGPNIPIDPVSLARNVINKYGADADKPSVHLAKALLDGAHERDWLRERIRIIDEERTQDLHVMSAQGREITRIRGLLRVGAWEEAPAVRDQPWVAALKHTDAIQRDVERGLTSAQIRDEIIGKVGMMASARTPEMQARYDAALERERLDAQPDPTQESVNRQVQHDLAVTAARMVIDNPDAVRKLNPADFRRMATIVLASCKHHHFESHPLAGRRCLVCRADAADIPPRRHVVLTEEQLSMALRCSVDEWSTSATEGTLFDLWCNHVGVMANTYESALAYAAFRAARDYFRTATPAAPATTADRLQQIVGSLAIQMTTAVACPSCGAKPGDACATTSAAPALFHRERVNSASHVEMIATPKPATPPAVILDDTTIDRILYAVCELHDTSDLWAHSRRDPEAWRSVVRRAIETRPLDAAASAIRARGGGPVAELVYEAPPAPLVADEPPTLQDRQEALRIALDEMRRALMALRLEVPQSVADEMLKRFEAVVEAFRRRHAGPGAELVALRFFHDNVTDRLRSIRQLDSSTKRALGLARLEDDVLTNGGQALMKPRQLDAITVTVSGTTPAVTATTTGGTVVSADTWTETPGLINSPQMPTPAVTKRPDGAYTVGPPPGGKSVDERIAELTAPDWTSHNGRSNRSPLFLELVKHVAVIIRESAHDLIAGRAETVAGVVMAQLAHEHNLIPRSHTRTGPLWIWRAWTDDNRLADSGWCAGATEDSAEKQAWQILGGPLRGLVKRIQVDRIPEQS